MKFFRLAAVAALGIMISMSGVSAASTEESALRDALKKTVIENETLRAELTAARTEIDRLKDALNARAQAAPVAPSSGAFAPLGAFVSSAPARTHTVAEGETLGSISAKYYGTPSDFKKILEANKSVVKDENLIYPGQELAIP